MDGVHRVHLSFKNIRKEEIHTVTLYRSFNDMNYMNVLDRCVWPITKTVIRGSDFSETVIDSFVAQNTIYTYYAKVQLHNGSVLPSNIATVSIPEILLPATNLPVSLFIDKCNYFLEVCFKNTPVKRYPINLGIRPENRKLYLDRSSTPEGFYRADYIRPKTDYHKAIGISYPNKTDKKRYNNALNRGALPRNNGKYAAIGGSIQIHGGGIGNNWTWGCIAMRNDDLDEIFSLSGFGNGIPITIVGTEFTRDSIVSCDTM
jgi:hypothetical protein